MRYINNIKIWLIGIVVLGAFLRLYGLGNIPVGITTDEVQQGYAAYSLLITSKDEWGEFLSLNPRGFGDYRPPFYTYLTIPSIYAFGLNEFSIRIVSAVSGITSIIILFLLAHELFKNKFVALLTALLLSISIWHVFYSRVGWESNLGSLLFITAIYLFLRSLKNKYLLPFSMIMFGLTMFTYFSFKMFTPLFLIGLGTVYFHQIRKINTKLLIVSFITFLVFLLPMLYFDFFAGGGRRAADAAIYNEENILPLRDIQIADKLPQPFGRVINNKVLYLFSQFIENYTGYFSTTFYISPHRSDATLFNIPGEWLISWWEALAITIAIIFMIRKNLIKEYKILFLLIILAPIPAALTRNYMHTQRVEILLFVLPILAAFGLMLVYKYLNSFGLRIIFISFLFIAIFSSLIYRIDHYMFHIFNRDMGGLKYGYKEIVDYVEENKDRYKEVVFTKEHSEPHIFVGFYAKIDPLVMQKSSGDWIWFEKEGFKFLDMINYKLDKYYFRNIDWNKDKDLENRLIVGKKGDFPPEVTRIKVVTDPRGKVLFEVVESTNRVP